MKAEKINGILSSLNGSVEYQDGEIKVQDEKDLSGQISNPWSGPLYWTAIRKLDSWPAT